MVWIDSTVSPTFTVLHDFHASAEHRFEHRILIGQCIETRQKQMIAHVQLDIFAEVGMMMIDARDRRSIQRRHGYRRNIGRR